MSLLVGCFSSRGAGWGVSDGSPPGPLSAQYRVCAGTRAAGTHCRAGGGGSWGGGSWGGGAAAGRPWSSRGLLFAGMLDVSDRKGLFPVVSGGDRLNELWTIHLGAGRV